MVKGLNPLILEELEQITDDQDLIDFLKKILAFEEKNKTKKGSYYNKHYNKLLDTKFKDE